MNPTKTPHFVLRIVKWCHLCLWDTFKTDMIEIFQIKSTEAYGILIFFLFFFFLKKQKNVQKFVHTKLFRHAFTKQMSLFPNKMVYFALFMMRKQQEILCKYLKFTRNKYQWAFVFVMPAEKVVQHTRNVQRKHHKIYKQRQMNALRE